MKNKILKKITLEDIAQSIENLSIETRENIEDLARITKKGLDTTVSREEFSEFKEEMIDFKTKAESTLFNLDSYARTTNERLSAIEKTLEPTAQMSKVLQKEIHNLNTRVTHLEA